MGKKRRKMKRRNKRLRLTIEMLLAMDDKLFEKVIAEMDQKKLRKLIATGGSHGEIVHH